jgi:tetratricopeptide (TPR) repeat protein
MAQNITHRSFTAICLPLLLLLLALPGWASVEAREESRHDTDALASNERRTVSFGNWTLELLYGARRDRSERRDPQPYIEKNRIRDHAKPNQVLTAAINLETSARHAAALRFAERGRKLLQAGESETALLTLEKSLSLDSIPYTYYYLARAHHDLSNYQESVTFLDVAASRLDKSPAWMAAVLALKGDNERALTRQAREKRAIQRAEESVQHPTRVTSLSMMVALALGVFLSFLLFTILWSTRLVKSVT